MQVCSLGRRTADDEIGEPQGPKVDGSQDGRRHGAVAEPAAHRHELVLERQDGVEDEWRAARDPPRARHVEVTGIADDQDVEVAPSRREQPRFRAENAERAPGPVAADGRLSLGDLDAVRPQRCDRIHVARMRAIVRPEVERPHGPVVVVGAPGRTGGAVVVGTVSVVAGAVVVGGATVVVGGATVVVGGATVVVGKVTGAVVVCAVVVWAVVVRAVVVWAVVVWAVVVCAVVVAWLVVGPRVATVGRVRPGSGCGVAGVGVAAAQCECQRHSAGEQGAPRPARRPRARRAVAGVTGRDGSAAPPEWPPSRGHWERRPWLRLLPRLRPHAEAPAATQSRPRGDRPVPSRVRPS